MLRWRVVVGLPVPAYDFLAPHGFDGDATGDQILGRRVLVPWQGGTRVGLVVGLEDAPDRGLNLREAIAVLDDVPLLRPDACKTLLEIARLNLAPDGLAYSDFMPFGLEPDLTHRARLVPGVRVDELPRGAEALADWSDALGHDPGLLDFLRSQGLLEEHAQLEQATHEVIRPAITRQAEVRLTPKQKKALEALHTVGRFESVAGWAREAGVSSGVVTALMRLGLAQSALEPAPAPEPRAPKVSPPKSLSQTVFSDLEDTVPIERIHGGRPRDRFAHLQQIIRQTDGGVLYLAPDRATLERAYRALGGIRPAGLLHFDLNSREREEVWRRARDGQTSVLFGTPMALLAPVQNLQLIVIEDEGSNAYKLQGGTRTFVPDAARIRANHNQSDSRIIAVGTVPAVESLLRPGVVLEPPRARVHVVDYANQPETPEIGPMSNFPVGRESWPISNALKKVLKQTAERGRQAVLIAPRRGYSAVIRCSDCGWLPFCPNCDVPLRYHAERRALECHQCGHLASPPKRCPRCEGTVFAPRGPGSEWIAEELARLLPSTRVLRYDRDRRDDPSPMARGEPGVIVGTTAVLSLEPPPDLALIALTFADSFATHPDFRSAERYHALLRQLIEWHPSRAPLLLVQTFSGQHPALQAVLDDHDAAFYPQSELELRRTHHYPPFVHLAQVQLASRRAPDAAGAARKLAALLRDRGATAFELLGPAPAPIARLKGLYAQNLLVRADTLDRLMHLLEPARRFRDGARVRVDMNPRSLSDLLG
jgi:primosomal protein N' (replication factor Y)